MIPSTCLHFIYKKDNTYNITFFINDPIPPPYPYSKELLPKSTINGIYSFEINPNTNFLINSNKLDECENWKRICCNFQINRYNILYNDINLLETENGYYTNDSFFELMNKYNINFKEIIKNNNYTQINILDNNNIDDKSLPAKLIDSKKKSYEKLLKKIQKYKIIDEKRIKIKIKKLKEKNINDIELFTERIMNLSLCELLDNNCINLYNYLSNIKINIFLDKLLKELDDKNFNKFESLIKINIDLFDTKKIRFQYNFEVLFELISGMELLDEQMERYINIIDKYNKYNEIELYNNESKKILNKINIFNSIGGSGNNDKKTKFIYPLHHFMMGKGKSKVLTPILMLYFYFIANKKIFIIVPPHLKPDTEEILLYYIEIYKIPTQHIQILSDDKIKEMFLDKSFNDTEANKNYMMLIDEFDSILDPLQSNYNIIADKSPKQGEIDNFIYEIVKKIKIIDKKIVLYEKCHSNHIYNLIIRDIQNIISSMNNNKLQYNINWGISPDNYYAIPYRTKDSPLLSSSFSSYINTIFLTYYYYKIKNPTITDNLIKYMKINDLNNNFNLTKDNFTLENILKIKNTEDIIDMILNSIVSKILLSITQKNTSFVDIINIDNIFKIGYSGTLNINLPHIESNRFSHSGMVKDHDEKINIKYAIYNSEIINSNSDNSEQIFEICKNYDALIDVIGFFKENINREIAYKIYNIFDKKRNVIYIDSNDNMFVIIVSKDEKYNIIKNYNNPFIYYSVAHIIGVDINQSNYPIMNGLCIIDNDVRYTTIAQAMSRLRKLNYGHSITFLYKNDNTISNKDLYQLFKNNDKNDKKNKKDYLIYQTIKSIIRKNKSIEQFDNTYNEKIKYYYNSDESNNIKILLNMKNDEYLSKEQLYMIFDSIFTESDIDDNYNLFKNISTPKQLLKLLYSIDTYQSLEQQRQQNQNQEQEQEQEQVRGQEYQQNKDVRIDTQFPLKSSDLNHYPIYTELNDIAINLDNDIMYLPNIFIHSNNEDTNQNKDNYAFIIVNSKLLLIPGYLIAFYIEEHVIYDVGLNIINTSLKQNIADWETNFIKNLKNHKLMQLFNFKFENISMDYTKDSDCLILLIAVFYYIIYIKQKANMTNFSTVIDKIKNNNVVLYIEALSKNKKQCELLFKRKMTCNIQILKNLLINNPTIKENYLILRENRKLQKKYLTYKRKYITLKNH